jgi:hypothetical protein
MGWGAYLVKITATTHYLAADLLTHIAGGGPRWTNS